MSDNAAINRPETLNEPAFVASLWHEFALPLRAFLARRLPAGADVDDLMQDVFMRVQRGIVSVRETERIGAWMFQVARSALADVLRARAKLELRTLATQSSLEGELTDAEDTPERLLALCVRPMLERLDEPYRQALQLVEVEGLTQAEAAARAGVTLAAMKSRVQRARTQLKESFTSCCQIDVDARGTIMSYSLRGAPAFASMGCAARSPCAESVRPERATRDE